MVNNFKSSNLLVPLLDVVPEIGEPQNHQWFYQQIKSLVREKYESDTIKIRITGFAKIVGNLIHGSTRVFFFFLIAFLILLFIRAVRLIAWELHD